MAGGRNRVVLATGNMGKLSEFRSMLAASAIELLSQSEFDTPEAIENGLSFIENALIKARNACRHTGLPALADDSGLAVDALGGQPGIYSSRYSCDESGEKASDSSNNQKLLNALAKIERAEDRQAQFVCALAFLRSTEDPVPLIATGIWHGTILKAPRGTNGFGYDPLFYVASEKCTAAEMAAQRKHRISHRALALSSLSRQLAGEQGL